MTRSCVEWWLFGCLAEDDPAMDAQWFVRAPPCVRHRHGAPPRDGADEGQVHGSRRLCRWRRPSSNVPGRRTWCDTPLLIRKLGFSTTDGCWLFDEIEGDRSVVPHGDNNVYLSFPHPAGDLVIAANKDRCWSSSAPPLTMRPPWNASSLRYAWRCEASAPCAPSSRWTLAASPRA